MDLLEAKGLEFPTTYEEFLECCEAIHDPEHEVYGACIGLQQGYLFPVYVGFLHINKGTLWKMDEPRTVIPDSRESIKAVEDMVYLYENYMPKAAIEFIASIGVGEMFADGKVGFTYYYPRMDFIPVLPEAKVKRVKPGIFPGHQGVVRSGGQLCGEGYAIPKLALHKEVAWDLIQWLTGHECQVQMFLSNDGTVAGEESAVSRWSQFKDARFRAHYPGYPEVRYDEILIAQLEQCKYNCSRYDRPHYEAFMITIEAEIMNALTRVKTPEDAMKDARERCDEIVEDEYQKYGGNYYLPWEDFQKPEVQAKIDDAIKFLKGEG